MQTICNNIYTQLMEFLPGETKLNIPPTLSYSIDQIDRFIDAEKTQHDCVFNRLKTLEIKFNKMNKNKQTNIIRSHIDDICYELAESIKCIENSRWCLLQVKRSCILNPKDPNIKDLIKKAEYHKNNSKEYRSYADNLCDVVEYFIHNPLLMQASMQKIYLVNGIRKRNISDIDYID